MNTVIKNALRRVEQTLRPLWNWKCKLPHAFSQEGEDLLLARVFERKRKGFYVDVGAHHPIRYSNTYLFYRRGWRGVNIDAMPGSMAPFRKLRKHDINIEMAIGEHPGSLPFYIFNDPALNTFDPEHAQEYDGKDGFRVLEKRMVEVDTLAHVLEKALPGNMPIDFMSVDVEGLDLQVLRSNDWKRFSPEYVLAEDLSCETIEETLQTPIATFMRSVGYALFAKTVHTKIYKRR